MLHYINTRWSILRRLLLIALVAFLPAVVIVRMIYVADYALIATTRDELAGLTLHAEVWQDMTGQGKSGRDTLNPAARDAINRYDSKTVAALEALVSAHDPVERVERAEKLIARNFRSVGYRARPRSSYVLPRRHRHGAVGRCLRSLGPRPRSLGRWR